MATDPPRKNQDGSLGPICGFCGGYGFTNVVTGGSAGCPHCLGSGVDERALLRARLDRIERAIDAIPLLVARAVKGGRKKKKEKKAWTRKARR